MTVAAAWMTCTNRELSAHLKSYVHIQAPFAPYCASPGVVCAWLEPYLWTELDWGTGPKVLQLVLGFNCIYTGFRAIVSPLGTACILQYTGFWLERYKSGGQLDGFCNSWLGDNFHSLCFVSNLQQVAHTLLCLEIKFKEGLI